MECYYYQYRIRIVFLSINRNSIPFWSESIVFKPQVLNEYLHLFVNGNDRCSRVSQHLDICVCVLEISKTPTHVSNGFETGKKMALFS